jgi:hypothetical protein
VGGHADLTLTAPTTLTGNYAQYNGLAIFFDRNNVHTSNPGIDLGGTGDINITGTIYALGARMEIRGDASSSVLNSSIIVDTYEAHGNGVVRVHYDPGQNVRTYGLALIR